MSNFGYICTQVASKLFYTKNKTMRSFFYFEIILDVNNYFKNVLGVHDIFIVLFQSINIIEIRSKNVFNIIEYHTVKKTISLL
jgi:hypothetical protein